MKKLIVTKDGATEVDLTSEEVAEATAAQQADTVERPKRTARERIAEQEARQTMRTLREAILGDAQAIARLQDIDDKIKTQRAIIQGA